MASVCAHADGSLYVLKCLFEATTYTSGYGTPMLERDYSNGSTTTCIM